MGFIRNLVCSLLFLLSPLDERPPPPQKKPFLLTEGWQLFSLGVPGALSQAFLASSDNEEVASIEFPDSLSAACAYVN